MALTPREGGTPYNGLYGEVSLKWASFSNFFGYPRGSHALTNMQFFRFVLGEQRNVIFLAANRPLLLTIADT